jgi:sugar transferase (PEP-CTERM/EpsH1 system associated)
MRILMLAPRFPYPPERGDTLRSWTVLEGLAGRHELWLACVDCSAPGSEQLEHVRGLCRELAVFVRSSRASLLAGLRGVLTGHSFTEGYFGDQRLRRTVAQWSEREPFDALLTYSSSIAPVACVVQARRRVLDLCDVDSHKWRRYARECAPPLRWCYRLESRRVALLEGRAARQHDVCLVVNERERRKISLLLPGVRVEVVPTTVEPARREPWPAPPEPVIGMLGSMSYPPNVHAVNWFGRLVWPLVKRWLPQARWLIVGRDPIRSVRAWGRLAEVEVSGRVPDVRPYLERMRVFVNPVRGDLGLQSKLLVAMACGRPAVTTSSAVAGLKYTGSPPCLVANSPRDFAAAVVRLVVDNELWQRLSRRAFQVVESGYTPQRQVEALELLLAESVDRRGRRGHRRELTWAC